MISIWPIQMWECPPSHSGWHTTYVPPDSPSYIGCPGVITRLPFHSQKYPDGMINYMTTVPLRKEKKNVPGLEKKICREGLCTKDVLSFYSNYDFTVFLFLLANLRHTRQRKHHIFLLRSVNKDQRSVSQTKSHGLGDSYNDSQFTELPMRI